MGRKQPQRDGPSRIRGSSVVGAITKSFSRHDVSLLSLALGSRAYLIIVAVVSSVAIGTRQPNLWHVDVPVLGLFARWDSSFYMEIARHGYSQPEFWAFRPLYPLVLRSLGTLLSPSFSLDGGAEHALLWAGFAAGLVFFLAGMFMFFRLSNLVLNGQDATWAVALMTFAPGAVFWTAIYPEALYLLLVTSCLYWLEVWKPARCAVALFMAGLARPEGVLLAIVFLGKAFASSTRRLSNLMLSGVAIGGQLAVVLFAKLTGGDFALPWQAEISWPKDTMAEVLLTGPPWGLLLSVNMITAFVLTLVLGYWLLTRSEREAKRLPYNIWMTALALVAFFALDYRSISRLALGALPLFWILGTGATRNRRLGSLTLMTFAQLSAGGTILFVNWYPFH